MTPKILMKFDWSHSKRGRQIQNVVKVDDFPPLSSHVLEMLQDREIAYIQG